MSTTYNYKARGGHYLANYNYKQVVTVLSIVFNVRTYLTDYGSSVDIWEIELPLS